MSGVCGTNGGTNKFYRFSGSASPVRVHGSPFASTCLINPIAVATHPMRDTRPDAQTLTTLEQVSVSLGASAFSFWTFGLGQTLRHRLLS